MRTVVPGQRVITSGGKKLLNRTRYPEAIREPDDSVTKVIAVNIVICVN